MMASISVPRYLAVSSKHLTDVYIALVDQVTKQERPFIQCWSMFLIVLASKTNFRPTPQKKNKTKQNKKKHDFASKKLSGDLKAQRESDEQHIYLVVI